MILFFFRLNCGIFFTYINMFIAQIDFTDIRNCVWHDDEKRINEYEKKKKKMIFGIYCIWFRGSRTLHKQSSAVDILWYLLKHTVHTLLYTLYTLGLIIKKWSPQRMKRNCMRLTGSPFFMNRRWRIFPSTLLFQLHVKLSHTHTHAHTYSTICDAWRMCWSNARVFYVVSNEDEYNAWIWRLFNT